MKRIIRKLKREAGFTLAETLITILILLLVTGLVAGGMPAAVSAYRNAIDAANAQVLLSTEVTALRNELTTARDVKVGDDGTSVTYTSGSTGSQTKIYISNDSVILLQEYDDRGDVYGQSLSEPPAPRELLSSTSTKTTGVGGKMTIVAEAGSNGKIFSLDNGVLTVGSVKVKRGNATIAQMPSLTIRVLTGGAGA